MSIEFAALVDAVRETRPLVHHITNYVTVNDCANVTLALGASPVMADAPEEAGEVAAVSSALVLNIGTLNERTICAMLRAGESANRVGVPVVFDPVGVGLTKLRNEAAAQILGSIKCAVIRCNASEARFLAQRPARTRGVDASDEDIPADVKDGIEIAHTISSKHDCVAAVTGPVDIVHSGNRTYLVENGHPAMRNITGTGCMCTSLVAALCACTGDHLAAAVCAISCIGAAAELAYEQSEFQGLGSFRVALIDAIGTTTSYTLREHMKVHETHA